MQDKLTEAMLADGWLPHDGGPCPVADDELLSIMFRDGEIVKHDNWMTAWHLDWRHSSQKNAPDDIIAYKLEPKP